MTCIREKEYAHSFTAIFRACQVDKVESEVKGLQWQVYAVIMKRVHLADNLFSDTLACCPVTVNKTPNTVDEDDVPRMLTLRTAIITELHPRMIVGTLCKPTHDLTV